MASGSAPPGPCRPGSGSGVPASTLRTAAGTTRTGLEGSSGVPTSRSAATTWRPAPRSRPQRSRASATSASSMTGSPSGAEKIARDLDLGLLAVVPVREGVRLDRLGLVLVGRGVPLIGDLEDVHAVVLDVDHRRELTLRRCQDDRRETVVER